MSKFRILRFLKNEGKFQYLQVSLVEEILNILNAKESNMSPVEQTPVMVFKIVAHQACQNGSVSSVRERDDDAARVCEKGTGLPQCEPWIYEMRKYIGNDNALELFPFELGNPIWIIKIELDDPLAEAFQNAHTLLVKLQGGKFAAI